MQNQKTKITWQTRRYVLSQEEAMDAINDFINKNSYEIINGAPAREKLGRVLEFIEIYQLDIDQQEIERRMLAKLLSSNPNEIRYTWGLDDGQKTTLNLLPEDDEEKRNTFFNSLTHKQLFGLVDSTSGWQSSTIECYGNYGTDSAYS